MIETSEGLKFVPGEVIETQSGSKFIPGQTIQTPDGRRFIPGEHSLLNDARLGCVSLTLRDILGQIVQTKAGPTFIPGQVIYVEGEGERFFPGEVIDTEDGPRFVPSVVIEDGDKVTFIKPQIVQTDQGKQSIIFPYLHVCIPNESAPKNSVNVNMTVMRNI